MGSCTHANQCQEVATIIQYRRGQSMHPGMVQQIIEGKAMGSDIGYLPGNLVRRVELRFADVLPGLPLQARKVLQKHPPPGSIGNFVGSAAHGLHDDGRRMKILVQRSDLPATPSEEDHRIFQYIPSLPEDGREPWQQQVQLEVDQASSGTRNIENFIPLIMLTFTGLGKR